MRLLLKICAVSLIMLYAATGAAFLGDSDNGQATPKVGGDQKEEVRNFMKSLGLTLEQKLKLGMIRSEHSAKLSSLRLQLQSLKKEKQGKPDAATMNVLKELKAEHDKMWEQQKLILTPDQQAKFKEFMDKRRRMRGMGE
jgi:Spy/CpxP family protein refolding chaperone